MPPEANGEGQVSPPAEVSDVHAGNGRRPRGRTVVLAALLVGLPLGGAGVWATRSAGGGHRLIYAKMAPSGRVFQCVSDGAVIGSVGTKVDIRDAPSPAPEGSEGGPAMVVRPPGFTEEQARRAEEEYRKSGRTVAKDEAEFDLLSAVCERRR